MSMVWLFEVGMYLLVAVGAGLLVGSSVWDGRLRKRCRYRSVSSKGGGRITVLMYARNNAATVTASLQSVTDGLFACDIVVVDDKSRDDTRKIVRAYQQAHPDVPLRLYARRSGGGRVVALREAYRRSKRGDSVFVLDADSQIGTGVSGSLAVFLNDQTVRGVQFAVAVQRTTQLGSAVQYLMNESRLQWMKTCALLLRQIHVFGENGHVYRAEVQGSRRLLPLRTQIHLLPGVMWRMRGGLTLSQRQSLGVVDWLRAVAAVSSLVVGIWLAYSAAVLQTGQPLLVAWAAVVIWFVVIVVVDEYSGVAYKFEYMFYIPVLSIVLYVYWVVQSAAILYLGLLPHHSAN